MSRVVRMLLVSALGVLGLGAMAGPASAGIWTEDPSGTTEDITALDYQSADRFWIATANGSIRYRESGVFQPATGVGLPTSIVFNDIAFQPGTNVGLAVGNTDNVWRSTDAGHTWSRLDPKTINNAFCGAGDPTPVDPGDMHTIAWGPNNVVYLGGAGKTILRSENAGATFTEVNKSVTGCKIDDEGISDIFFFPSATSRNDEKLYFQARDAFGKMYFSADGLLSTAIGRDESINGTEDNTNLAVDPTNTNRLWATNQCGFTCLGTSVDGAANFDCVCTIRNEGTENQNTWMDIEYAGGTIVAAGRAGQIVNSIDGVNFFYNKADGALATKDWAAVGMASGADAAVGGQGGALVVTTAANTVPDIAKPTGTISGPSTVVAGQPATFTLAATDTGGSGLNPASFAWTATGVGPTTGNPATFTFPAADLVTVKVTFADNAGNVAEATKSVSVRSAPALITPSISLTGKGNKATARIVGNKIKVRMKGAIALPAGANPAVACTGKIRLKVKKGKKVMANRTVGVKFKRGKCRFAKTITLKRSKVGKTRSLRLQVRFLGNTVLKAGSTSRTLVIKK